MKAYTDNINVNEAVSVDTVIAGAGGANDRCEPYATEPAQTKRTHIKSLIAKAAQDNGVTYEAIMSRARPRDVCRARFDAIASVAAAYPDMSFPRIGKIFNRDHSSIVHALMMRGVQPRSGRIAEYRKFAALMQRKAVGNTPTEGEATNGQVE
jgi:hypothetical protein